MREALSGQYPSLTHLYPQGNFDKACTYFKKCYELSKEVANQSSLPLAAVHFGVASAHTLLEEFSERLTINDSSSMQVCIREVPLSLLLSVCVYYPVILPYIPHCPLCNAVLRHSPSHHSPSYHGRTQGGTLMGITREIMTDFDKQNCMFYTQLHTCSIP